MATSRSLGPLQRRAGRSKFRSPTQTAGPPPRRHRQHAHTRTDRAQTLAAKTSLPTRRPAVGSHESTDRIGPGPRAGERSGPTPGPVGVPASRSDTCAPLGLISVRSPSRNGRHRLITVVHPPQHCPRVRIDPNVAPQRRDATAGQISTQRHAVGHPGRQKTAGVPITGSDSAGLIGAQPVVVGAAGSASAQPISPRFAPQPDHTRPRPHPAPAGSPASTCAAGPAARTRGHPPRTIPSAGRRSTHPTSSDLPSVAPGAAGSTTPKLDAPRERSGLKWPSVDRRGGNGPLAQRDDAVSGGPPAVNPASAASSSSAAPR